MLRVAAVQRVEHLASRELALWEVLVGMCEKGNAYATVDRFWQATMSALQTEARGRGTDYRMEPVMFAMFK